MVGRADLRLEVVGRPVASELLPVAEGDVTPPAPAVSVVETGTCTVHLPLPQVKVDKAVQTALQEAGDASSPAVCHQSTGVQTLRVYSTTRGCQARVRVHAVRTQTVLPLLADQDCQTEEVELVDGGVQTEPDLVDPEPLAVTAGTVADAGTGPGAGDQAGGESGVAASAADSPPATGE